MTDRLFSMRIAFSVFLLVAFAYGIWESLSYAYLARIFPLYISIVLFALAGVNLVNEIRLVRRDERRGDSAADLASEWDIPMGEVFSRFGVFSTVIVLLYGFTWLIGYPISITFFIIIMYRYVAKARWRWAIVAGLAGLGFLALVSDLLYMDWPEGLIKLPWPLG